VSGVLVLTEAAPVFQVPPSTVFAIDGTSGCVTSKGADIRVRIVGSKLGKTFVVPGNDDAKLPETVDLPSGGERTCKAK
jgi:hypothetical protein